MPPDSGSPLPLQKARTIAADGQSLATLSWDGTTLSYYTPGNTTPTKIISLPAPCLTLAPRPEAAGFLTGGPDGLWEVSSNYRIRLIDDTPTLQLLANASFVLSQTTPTTLAAHTPASPHLILTSTSVPGPLQTWWMESPNSAAGTFRYQDTFYAFTYQSAGRLFTIDTSRPAPSREKAASPYLTHRWGTEYIGTLTLLPEGTLTPLNLSAIQCFAVDFLGGYLYYVRQDTLWERNLHTGATHPRATSFRAGRMKVTGAYAQGRASVTTR